MRRREFLSALGGAAAVWPLAARAQQPHAPHRRAINVAGTIRSGRPASPRSCRCWPNWAGSTAATCGSSTGGPPAIPRAFADMQRNWWRSRRRSSLPPAGDCGSVAAGDPPVPIVFVHTTDPVGAGLVDSLARPGGNATGFTLFEYGIGGKWLELLKQIAPDVTRVAVIRDPALAAGTGQLGAIQSVAPASMWSCGRSVCATPARSSAMSRPSRAPRMAA